MKTKYIIISGVVVIAVLLVVVAVSISSRQIRSTDITGLTFEELCHKNGDMWMEMEPRKDGKKISDEMCLGCMIGDNHFCKAEEYIDHIKELQASQLQDKEPMTSMAHKAMTAHAGKNNYVDVHKYSVRFIGKDISSASNSGLTFIIKNTESDKPVSNLEIVHDKIMHVILVKTDLKYFDHIHPNQKEPGVFYVPYSFYAPGDYRIWVDFTVEGMQHIVDFDATVYGASQMMQADGLSGLKVDINVPATIQIGEPIKIDFIVRDTNNIPLSIKEKFLAANAHLIVIDESLDKFDHVHDEKIDGDNILSFEYKFQKAGPHKLWIQFSVNSITRTGEFDVTVNE